MTAMQTPLRAVALTPEITAALTRLAAACFLADIGIDVWVRMPAAARRQFAASLDGLPDIAFEFRLRHGSHFLPTVRVEFVYAQI